MTTSTFSVSASSTTKDMAPTFGEQMLVSAVQRMHCPVTPAIRNMFSVILQEAEHILFHGATPEQVREALIQSALQNVKDEPLYDMIAAGLYLNPIYTVTFAHGSLTEAFIHFIYAAVKDSLLDSRMESDFDLIELGNALAPERDSLLNYTGLTTLNKRYTMKDRDQKIMEIPQFFFMRVAMGLSLNEKNPTEWAIKFYNKMSKLEYLAAGSTLANAGTNYPQLSNCFLMDMQDDMMGIADAMKNVMMLTKGTGGIGLSVTKLRSQGSPIKRTNTFSTGPIPFMHAIDSTLRAVSRGGKKFGALCFYIENWHLDFPDFLDLKDNSGDPYRRTRTANTAVWISDEFMRRVDADEDWYLFDPAEVMDLNELYGAQFAARYNHYCVMAQEGKMRDYKVISAKEQFKTILIKLQATSHPWITFKDAINVRALNNNTGTIHLSNLCTEITLPQDKDNIAVCNLASINLAKHVKEERDELLFAYSPQVNANDPIDLESLEDSIRLAVRQLDNLIDITISMVPESEYANAQNRAIGLGVMGFTDMLEQIGFAYDSPAAVYLMDKLMEFISYIAIDESANLAQERGSYPNFMGSGWSHGRVPFDTIQDLAISRNDSIHIWSSGEHLAPLNWNILREKVSLGMRNSTLMAIAPTANIGLIANTTPSIDPRFAQMFSRTTSSGKFLELNKNLVNNLKDEFLWRKVKEDILKAQGDISGIDAISDHLKNKYKTSFDINPYAYIHIASAAQKWIDQSISRNMYLDNPSIDDMVYIYLNAWKSGLKTTYYAHMKPRHAAEQSTISVNKSVAITGTKKGFGFGKKKMTTDIISDLILTEEEIQGQMCPIDPAERLACDSCQ